MLVERVAMMHPDRTAAEVWREMGPEHRQEWLWHEENRHVEDTWSESKKRTASRIDPDTGAAFRSLVKVSGVTALDHIPARIHWSTFWSTEATDPEYVIEPLFPAGRQTAILARPRRESRSWRST